MNIGVDIDGVLARFEHAYAELLTKETGVVFPVYGADEPKTWYWERDEFARLGWSRDAAKAAEKKVWDHILNSDFWATLSSMPLARTTLEELAFLQATGNNVYFITARPGAHAKRQTEAWLAYHGMKNPTVLIAGSDHAKGQLAKGLKLDVFIDDKPENCAEVNVAFEQHLAQTGQAPTCRIFLVDAPYNRALAGEMPTYLRGVVRVTSALQALERVTERSVDGEQLRRAAA